MSLRRLASSAFHGLHTLEAVASSASSGVAVRAVFARGYAKGTCNGRVASGLDPCPFGLPGRRSTTTTDAASPRIEGCISPDPGIINLTSHFYPTKLYGFCSVLSSERPPIRVSRIPSLSDTHSPGPLDGMVFGPRPATALPSFPRVHEPSSPCSTFGVAVGCWRLFRHDGAGDAPPLAPSAVVDTLKYAKSHEWVKIEGDVATYGISDHAQAELGAPLPPQRSRRPSGRPPETTLLLLQVMWCTSSSPRSAPR